MFKKSWNTKTTAKRDHGWCLSINTLDWNAPLPWPCASRSKKKDLEGFNIRLLQIEVQQVKTTPYARSSSLVGRKDPLIKHG